MAKSKVANPKQAVAESINKASFRQKQAEVKETQFMVQRMQAEAQQKKVEANKARASIMIARSAVAKEKALSNRPEPSKA